MEVNSKEWNEYINKKHEKELQDKLKELDALKNCEIKYLTIYHFGDQTQIIDKDEAIIYSSKYYDKLDKLYMDLSEYTITPLSVTQFYKQYDKDIINNFKKDFYNILWEIFKERYGKSQYDEYFEKFVNNPENDMQGAARCIHNVPFNWNLVNWIGIILLSFDHLGRYFGTFPAKCNYLDDEVESKTSCEGIK